jgi:hypothetical protein
MWLSEDMHAGWNQPTTRLAADFGSTMFQHLQKI